MKRFAMVLNIAAALAVVVTLTSTLPCCSIVAPALAAEKPAAATARLHIDGMTCGACAMSARIVLEKIDGVSVTQVSHEEKSAVVTYDPAKVTPQQLADTVNAKLPYKATVVADGKARK